jgi:hypothetical protein
MTARKVLIDLNADSAVPVGINRRSLVAASRARSSEARREFMRLIDASGLEDVVVSSSNDSMFPAIVITASEESLAVIATFSVVANIHDADSLAIA